ncbi:MAG: RNB domain-containing ribonuclease [Micrococcales bacterium]|nr:RNB domain-containing ribonuclease [Micrococcales bacterium]
MTLRRVSLHADSGSGADTAGLRAAFDAIRIEFQIPATFPPAVLAEAQSAAVATPRPQRDETAVEFVTIDPPGSMDLDQAMALGRDGSGYRVRYAIADVPAFVVAGGAIDVEARARVETLYLPDARSPLHPPVLSEEAASLLPGVDRPAYVWDLRLDAASQVTGVEVYRALVRSRARFDYAGVQADIDSGRAPEGLALLAEIGTKRQALEIARGGASLPMPEQEVVVDQGGRYTLRYRPSLPAEEWNAQISLMTGMAAATLMLGGQVGILRTMPEPDPQALTQFRRTVAAMGASWPQDQTYGAFLRGLDQANAAHLAIIHEATTLFRGAGYTPFDAEMPAQRVHAAVAAPYAHVTAPLRRLVDRFGLAVCAALSAGEPVPQWARAALPQLAGLMRAGDQRAAAVARACRDAAEAAELSGRIGQEFDAVVVDDRGSKGSLVALTDPAILAPCTDRAEPGTTVRVRLTAADLLERTVRFEVVR